ncbi:hypothetical protein PF003_g36922 [Phytophthora fragariae]|nr:hypothetical protein PF003_g36922 [Phytophthora fragariae]
MAVPVLASVAVVSRQYEAIGALEHIVCSISDYIDYSQCWTMARAAAGGHVALLRRLHAALGADANSNDGFSTHDVERAMELSAQSGHLEVVQFLQINYPQRGKTWSLELAASNGQLAVLQWLHEHGGDKDRLTMSAFDDAAENGHLDVVKWLHDNRAETPYMKTSGHNMDPVFSTRGIVMSNLRTRTDNRRKS